MDAHIKKLYKQARRFDEGELYQAEEYSDLAKRQYEILEMLSKLKGPEFDRMMDEILKCLSEEMELECQHYFYEGYLAGRAEEKENK